ncbi:Elongation factor Tu [Linum perenne]
MTLAPFSSLRGGDPRPLSPEQGKAKAVAFDKIDKASEEKKRGITIAMEYDSNANREVPVEVEWKISIDEERSIFKRRLTASPIEIERQVLKFNHLFSIVVTGWYAISGLFLNKCDAVADLELFELVEMELRGKDAQIDQRMATS